MQERISTDKVLLLITKTFVVNYMEKYLLGIDVGTTGTKTILFTDEGEVISHAYRSYPLSNLRVGESEQNPLDWWKAICETVHEVTEGRSAADKVAAISLSTQGGTLVAVDKSGAPVRPAIVWNDIRFTEEREKYLSEIGDAETLYQKTGFRLGRGLPLLAIRYIKDKEPEAFEKSDKFLSVPSYISLKMTGRAAVDFSNAGIEELVDIRKRRYDPELLDFAGINESRLAELVMSGEVIGNLTEEAARELGLSEETLLVSGAHDQYAVALGAGSVSAGNILIGSGTSWVIVASGSEPDFECGLSQSVAAVPGLFGTLRSLSSGGVCLDWFRNFVAVGSDGESIDYATINSEVEKIRAAEDGLFFYPFKGTCGDGKSFSKGAFTGMDLSHNRYHLIRAVMEGVVFQVLWMMEAFKTKPGKDGLILAGGASKSEVWAKMLADVSGLPIRIPEIADLACVGAAILAGFGAGIYPSCEEGYSRFKIKERVILPRSEMTEKYKPIFEKYKKQAAILGSSY